MVVIDRNRALAGVIEQVSPAPVSRWRRRSSSAMALVDQVFPTPCSGRRSSPRSPGSVGRTAHHALQHTARASRPETAGGARAWANRLLQRPGSRCWGNGPVSTARRRGPRAAPAARKITARVAPLLKALHPAGGPVSASSSHFAAVLAQQPRPAAAGSRRQASSRPGDYGAPWRPQQARKGLELRIKMRLISNVWTDSVAQSGKGLITRCWCRLNVRGVRGQLGATARAIPQSKCPRSRNVPCFGRSAAKTCQLLLARKAIEGCKYPAPSCFKQLIFQPLLQGANGA